MRTRRCGAPTAVRRILGPGEGGSSIATPRDSTPRSSPDRRQLVSAVFHLGPSTGAGDGSRSCSSHEVTMLLGMPAVHRRLAAVLLAAVAAVAACAGDGDSADPGDATDAPAGVTPPRGTAVALTGDVTVFAAASLT